MSGLILKDFLTARRALRSYFTIPIFYFVLTVMGMFDLTFVTVFMTLLVMLLPMGAFSYDEQAKWDRYAMSLPLGRRGVVGARYLFALLLALFAGAFGTAVCAVLSVTGKGDLLESLLTILATLAVCIWMVAILLPLCYKLGPERARIYMFVLVFAPIILMFLAVRLGIHIDLSFLDGLSDGALMAGFALFPLSGLLALGVSYFVSCAIVERKEF